MKVGRNFRGYLLRETLASLFRTRKLLRILYLHIDFDNDYDDDYDDYDDYDGDYDCLKFQKMPNEMWNFTRVEMILH